MIFEPESWAGLRSPSVIAGEFGGRLETTTPASADHARPSAFRSAARRVAGLIDRVTHRDDGHDDPAEPPKFLRERRVTVFDPPRS